MSTHGLSPRVRLGDLPLLWHGPRPPALGIGSSGAVLPARGRSHAVPVPRAHVGGAQVVQRGGPNEFIEPTLVGYGATISPRRVIAFTSGPIGCSSCGRAGRARVPSTPTISSRAWTLLLRRGAVAPTTLTAPRGLGPYPVVFVRARAPRRRRSERCSPFRLAAGCIVAETRIPRKRDVTSQRRPMIPSALRSTRLVDSAADVRRTPQKPQ